MLCYLWLKPYTKNKLEPKSCACIFVGYSSSQSAYKCFDPITHRVFVSRHVQFNENEYPFQLIDKNKPRVTTSNINSWGLSESLVASLAPPHFSIPSASHMLLRSVSP